MQRFQTTFVVKAPIDDVFDVFADHYKFGALFGAKSWRVVSGKDTANGVGSARRLGFWPIDFDESVVDYAENKLINYRVSRGSPLKNHFGELRVSETEGGTLVNYSVRFESKVPFMGPLLGYGFRKAWSLNSAKVFSRLEAKGVAQGVAQPE